MRGPVLTVEELATLAGSNLTQTRDKKPKRSEMAAGIIHEPGTDGVREVKRKAKRRAKRLG